MHEHNELTRGAFVAYMKDYVKQLLKDPIRANINNFLKQHGISNEKALSLLLKAPDKNNPNSAVLIRTERIIDNGIDENGKKNQDTFSVTYKAPRYGFNDKLKAIYGNLYEYSHIVNEKIGFDKLNEDGEGGTIGDSFAGSEPGSADGNNAGPGALNGAQYSQPLTKNPIRRTIYVTDTQANLIKEALNMNFDDYGYDVPMNIDKNDPTLNHKNIMKKSWNGNVEEDINIKPENKGKFTQTKKRTGKSTEELTHSKNPLTRKRATFAKMAKRHWKPL